MILILRTCSKIFCLFAVDPMSFILGLMIRTCNKTYFFLLGGGVGSMNSILGLMITRLLSTTLLPLSFVQRYCALNFSRLCDA